MSKLGITGRLTCMLLLGLALISMPGYFQDALYFVDECPTANTSILMGTFILASAIWGLVAWSLSSEYPPFPVPSWSYVWKLSGSSILRPCSRGGVFGRLFLLGLILVLLGDYCEHTFGSLFKDTEVCILSASVFTPNHCEVHGGIATTLKLVGSLLSIICTVFFVPRTSGATHTALSQHERVQNTVSGILSELSHSRYGVTKMITGDTSHGVIQALRASGHNVTTASKGTAVSITVSSKFAQH